MALRQRTEHNNLVDTVDELRTHLLFQQFQHSLLGLLQLILVHRAALQPLANHIAAHVRGHDDNRILEVGCAALIIRQSAILQHLQQSIEHVGVSLFNLVEEDNAVGFATHGLSQLAALVIAYVSRRRSNQSRHAVTLLVLAHIDTHHHVLIVKHHFGQGACQFGLTHACGSEEEEAAYGSATVAQTRTATAYGVGYCADGLVLSHHTFVQLIFQVKQTFAFALQHTGDGDAGPLGDHLGNLLRVHLLINHCIVGLHGLQLLFQVGHVLLGLLDAAVAQFGHLAVVAGTLGLLGLELVAFDILHLGLYLLDDALLVLPAGFHLVALLTQRAQLLVYLGYLVLVILALDGFALNLQLTDTALNLIQLLGHRVNLKPQLGGGLVDEVYGLVGQETVADVAVRELGGGDDGLVLDTHTVVHLVALLQSTQDADGVRHRRLVDEHALEPTLQGLVLLEILLVLGQRGGADGPQLASCQCGLQDVGGVHSALSPTRSHEGVYLVDEEDNLAVGLVDFADDAFQPLLKLALVLGTGNQCAHVEAVDGLALQVLRHVAADNTVRQALRDGGLTHAGLTNQYGVVLGPAAEDLQHTADLFVTPNDGVQFARLRQLVEVFCILVKGVIAVLGALAAHLAALAQVGNGGAQALIAHTRILHQARQLVASGQEAQQQMLNGDEVVAHLSGQLSGLDEGLIGIGGEVLAPPADARQTVDQCVHLPAEPGDIHLQLLQQERSHILVDTQNSLHQVPCLDSLVLTGHGNLLCLLYGFLCFDCEFV